MVFRVIFSLLFVQFDSNFLAYFQWYFLHFLKGARCDKKCLKHPSYAHHSYNSCTDLEVLTVLHHVRITLLFLFYYTGLGRMTAVEGISKETVTKPI